jgi:hypothetical protein
VNRAELQSILQQPYERQRWLDMLRTVLPGTDVFASPQPVSGRKHNESILQLGRVRLYGGQQLALLESMVGEAIDLTRSRVGLRSQVARLVDLAEYHGVLAVFYSKDSQDYRFTFAAREAVFDPEGNLTKRETAPRRFTYILGPNEACRTAAERFSQLAAKAHGVELKDVIDAFSVEKLNKEFFAAFCRAFEQVRAEISQRRSAWSDATTKSEAQTLLNRLLFLYFVQRKGWLNRQRDYLIENFRSGHHGKRSATSYHVQFLQPLFQRLSTEQAPALLPDHDLPFLNGGLFNDEYGEELFKHHTDFFLSNETFDYIFENLLEPYNFTIHEDSPNNYEVAIDPEMLGRIFEALVLQGEESEARGKSVRHDTGSHYTPRPIVHYVCRNTLAAWLETQPPFASRDDAHLKIAQLFELDAAEGVDEEMRVHLDQCLTTGEAATLRDCLFELRACDPAVGSGAFPMGLLHELVNLIRLCEARARGKDPVERNARWLYETKKHIIEYVLYGVDIQDRAIEICKLRLWLSLMVDHELEVDPFNCDARSFRSVLKVLDPLPNLDFKIRCANSLVDFIHGQMINLGAHDSSDRTRPVLSKLIKAKRDFYEARTAKEKRRLRFVIYEATAELADFELGWTRTQVGLIDTNNDPAFTRELDRAQKALGSVFEEIRGARGAKVAEQESALERIQSWFEDPINPTFVWQLDFAEVFHRHQNGSPSGTSLQNTSGNASTGKPVRHGFDLLIGNPPYVRIQTLTKSDPDAVAYYKERFRAAQRGNYDLYVVFVERGLGLLDERTGQLGYILPHKFFNARYGEPLRKLISRGKHLRHVVHFGDQQIFPGATNYVCLLFLASAGAEECLFVRANDLKLWLATQHGMERLIWSSEINSNEWNFAAGKGASLFERMKELPVRLSGIVRHVSQGIRTSANEVYVLSVERRDEPYITAYSEQLDEKVELEQEAVHQFLGGREIKPYRILSSNKVAIIPYRLAHGKMLLIPPEEYEAVYPKVWKYLQRNRHYLESRENGKMKGERWYGFVYPKNLEVMTSAKILVPDIADRASFALDENGKFAFTSGYGITLKPDCGYSLKFVLAIANSLPLDFYWRQISTPLRGGFFRYFTQFIEQLPVPRSTVEQQRTIELLAEYVLWLHCQPSVAGSDPKRPQDPAVASLFEQIINALVYELFFLDEISSTGLHFFQVVSDSNLPLLNSLPHQRQMRLDALFRLFQMLDAPGHPMRIALDKLQTLDLVRIVEGKS